MKSKDIIVYDIETSPNVVYSWRVGYNINLDYSNIIQERKIICICWKHLGYSKVHHLEWDHEKQCDRQLLIDFHDVLDKCQVAIGHNGDRFDLKHIKARNLLHRLKPLTNITTIDTLKLSRANFGLNSHRLDYIGQALGAGKKIDTGGFSLWVRVMEGERKALNEMVKYCKQDVNLLEQVFLEMLPYVDRLPVSLSLVLNGDKNGCTNCGSSNVINYGKRYTRAGIYQRYACKSCGFSWRGSRMLAK